MTILFILAPFQNGAENEERYNLLQEVEGVMPASKSKMIDALNAFINLPDEQRLLFQVGKRLRIFSGLADLNDSNRVHIAQKACIEYGITPKNVDHINSEASPQTDEFQA